MGTCCLLWAGPRGSLRWPGDVRQCGNAWIGGLDHLFLRGVSPFREDGVSVFPMAGSITAQVFMIFQGMFFIITPALICGAFAERVKFSAMVLFMLLWGTFVYCPLAHWVWGGGWLGTDGVFPGLDFAGGTVVH